MGQSAAHKKTTSYLKHNIKIDSKHFSGKQNVSPNNVLLFKTLHTTPRRHISLTQADTHVPFSYNESGSSNKLLINV